MLCYSASVLQLLFSRLCSSGCVPQVVFSRLCSSGCVPQVVFLMLCSSGCVLLVLSSVTHEQHEFKREGEVTDTSDPVCPIRVNLSCVRLEASSFVATGRSGDLV
ncbi:unnamed protein product [Pleuronectes platessa]|uniref:Secreted protein n=1 Tax=Pleuronectes platessa TaxID=8262 RepID=A0A9N7VM82_PLEPL|nr:unnamed protein product [Pleuronectes platessa]